jgi:DNA modification methylase
MDINKIYNCDCLKGLEKLPDNSVDCCVTSPPYYGLRDYGTAAWEGGNPDCAHKVGRGTRKAMTGKQKTNQGSIHSSEFIPINNQCPICGAVRIDKQIGLEETPELYIARLVGVFTEVYRVLKPSGTLWLNIGDSYWGGKGYSGSSAGRYQYERRKTGKSITREYSNIAGKGEIRPTDRKHEHIKAKDLIGIPWMLAFALRNAGWYLRQDIIWHKPNSMPESVKDRCTKAHEYIFLLSKSAHYYFDCEAILEPYTESLNRWAGNNLKASGKSEWGEATGQSLYRDRNMRPNAEGRNKRDVWSVCTKPEKESHFAVFPQSLIADCIKAGCPENGIVLDPFMGSGTTAVVARKLNRNYIGFELNPEYVKISNRKIYNQLGMFL